MRLFVAVLPPACARDHLRDAVEDLNVVHAGAGVVAPERWHLTLTFLGEIDDVEPVLARIALGVAAGRRTTLTLAGGGSFGDGVLWAGVGGDVDGLVRTALAVRRAVRLAGVPAERTPFQPHLTLARPRGRVTREELRADVERLRTYAGPEWDADRVHLISSTRSGYSPVAEWVLPHQA